MKDPILITGGTGFVAHQLQRTFSAASRACHLLDRTAAPDHRPSEAPVTIGDVRDPDLVDRLVRESSAVVHLAAVVGVDDYLKNPGEVLDVNISGTRNVLTSCLAHGKPVIFASTSEVYGRNTERLREDSAMILGSSSSPRWSYAVSKAVGEHHTRALTAHGLQCAITRYFNVYGPLLDAPGRGRVLSKWLGRLQQGQPLRLVDGGNAVRSFCYVDEAAQATAELLFALEAGRIPSGSAFNVGRDEPVSMLELAERMLALVGRPGQLEVVPGHEAFGRGFEEIPFRVPDVSAIRAAIGFEARIELDEGLSRVLEHWDFAVQPAARKTWIPTIQPQFHSTLDLALELQGVLASGRVSNEGPRVNALEEQTAEFLGVDGVAATSTGSDALILLAWALRPRLSGRKVIVPSFTYIATLAAWEHAGFDVLFCDIDDETFTLASDALSRLLADHDDIAAVMAVTAYGVPPDLESLSRLLAPRGIPLLLDDSHGFGSSCEGLRSSPHVLAATYSLHATKVLPAVEGGLVWTRDAQLQREIVRLRGHGLTTPRQGSTAGFNARLDELRATIALAQLDRFPLVNARRQASAQRLRAVAQRYPAFFQVQRVPERVSSNFQNLAVRCFPGAGSSLDRVIEEFAQQGVEARRYFAPPLHHLAKYPSPHALPNTDAVYDSLLCLPIHDEMSEAALRQLEQAMQAVAAAHAS
ncbi:MAG: aminotransferase class I/II-fold pyridoxal phosphate-dependent enzyme [Polyangiaceae bacterium]|nr:aminotransferase class I/II-fold pyridoxal phosphate-dependent enzyme [Polyangiaceae bacterium]